MVSFENFQSFKSSIFENSALPFGEINASTRNKEFYPEINISRELFHGPSIKTINDNRSILVPVNENLIKRITRTYFEEGFEEALKEASNLQTASSSPIISLIAKKCLDVLKYFYNIQVRLRPHLKDKGISNIAKFSPTREWATSSIRYIRWHPNCFKIAVAALDDSIRIYTDEPTAVSVVKTGVQKNISAMAWRPFSAGELAVACEAGILVWTLDPSIHITRPFSQAAHFKHPKHTPVTSVEWSPDGTLLASASVNDSNILIWNIDENKNEPLRRVGPPSSFIKWSSNGAYLFSSTIGNVFRVWNTDKWVPDRWTVTSGSIKSAAWSPCGQYLLFVTTDDSILYRLQFVDEQLFASTALPKQALSIADLSKVSIEDKEIGGIPQMIEWDPCGCYLAIIFKDSSSVAIFSTIINKHNLTLTPSFYIDGCGPEYPSFICFQSKYKKISNSVLTIGWSSGRVQYFPFINM